jgi:hypothetical protein
MMTYRQELAGSVWAVTNRKAGRVGVFAAWLSKEHASMLGTVTEF